MNNEQFHRHDSQLINQELHQQTQKAILYLKAIHFITILQLTLIHSSQDIEQVRFLQNRPAV